MAGLSMSGEFHPPLPDEPEKASVTVAELAELRRDRERLDYVIWNHDRCADFEATSFRDRATIDRWIAVETEFANRERQ